MNLAIVEGRDNRLRVEKFMDGQTVVRDYVINGKGYIYYQKIIFDTNLDSRFY